MPEQDIEENLKNPTIADVKAYSCPHYFLLKYKSEKERVKFAEMITKLVKKFELKDFHIEERKAYLDTKIFYNFHTLIVGDDFSYDAIEREFKKYLKV